MSISISCDKPDYNGYPNSNAIDGNAGSFWTTQTNIKGPYTVTFKFDQAETINSFSILPRNYNSNATGNGDILGIELWVSDDGNEYRKIAHNKTFDYLPSKSKKSDATVLYHLPFRIVRFPISDNSYEVVVTNLDATEFPPDSLKKLYGMRWGIETSFRDLKYTIGLLHFHSKKVEYILQEIFASLIMYNFSELITSHVVIEKGTRKYEYKVNFSVAVHICREFLLKVNIPPDIESLIARYITPIRPGRSRPREMKVKQAISFMYRVA